MSEPIRVLHVIGIMNRGGAETMIMNLYRHIDRNKVQFDFVENSNEPAAFDEEILSLGGKIFRCPHYNGKNHFGYVKWWNDFFKEHRGEYPIIHGHLGSTAAIYLSAAKKYGIYTIAHSHNTNAASSLQQIIYNVYSYPTRFIADHFFTCSTEAAYARFGRKVSENRQLCQTLRNAIDLQEFCFSTTVRDNTREEFGIGKNTFVIGHIGRFAEQKNHRFLIEVFKQIIHELPETVLLLVGDGELRHEIETTVSEYGIADKVVFTGVQTNVQKLYQAMDVFAFPSLYEGLPVTMVEAQAAGLPCIISDKVPPECIITEGLVDILPLSAEPALWAEKILEKQAIPRTDRRAEIAAHGFNITTEAVKLQEFYLETARKE